MGLTVSIYDIEDGELTPELEPCANSSKLDLDPSSQLSVTNLLRFSTLGEVIDFNSISGD